MLNSILTTVRYSFMVKQEGKYKCGLLQLLTAWAVAGVSFVHAAAFVNRPAFMTDHELVNVIQMSSNGKCINSRLTVSGVSNASLRIDWKKDGKVKATSPMPAPISTVAGGTEGDDPGQLRFPFGVYVDATGNVYVADQYNHRIQKWAPGATAGVTVAGGKGQGNAPDQLNYPYTVVTDKAGNLYVADAGNHRIQKWVPGATKGVTVAGGNGKGSAANQLEFPYGLAIDQQGAIYIADYYNHRVQKWVPGADRGITVAGGNGKGEDASQLQYPNGVFVDEAENIYVADSRNDRIQLWKEGDTIGVTVAGGHGRGNKDNQLYYPTSVYVDYTGALYIADVCNNRIQRWTNGAYSGTTVAGGTTTDLLKYPYGVCLDAKGNLYVSDQQNHRVRKYINRELSADYTFTAQEPGTYTADIFTKDLTVITVGSVTIDSLPVVAPITGKTLLSLADQVILSNTSQNGTWKSSNDSIVSINNNGLLLAKAPGKATIDYTILNQDGCPATISTVVSVESLPWLLLPKGVDSFSTVMPSKPGAVPVAIPARRGTANQLNVTHLKPVFKVTAMANPVVSYFTLKLEGNEHLPVMLHVTSFYGRLMDRKINLSVNEIVRIGEGYAPGTYIAELVQGQSRQVMQLVKLG